MRPLALAFVVLLASAASAQWAEGLDRAVREAFPARPETPQPDRQTGDLPPPLRARDNVFEIVNADTVELDGDLITLSGNVRARNRGYDVSADKVVIDRPTQVFTLTGNGRVVGEHETITGEEVVVDFDDETFSYREGTAVFQSARLEGNLLAPLHVRGGSGSGTRTRIHSHDGGLTFCDLPHPHFEVTATDTDVIPGRRAVLRDIRLKILGRTIVRLPYLSVPLTQHNVRYLPEFGQSRDEGYFVKTRFTTPLPGESFFDTRLDYMTLRGLGYGVEYNYLNDDLSGLLTLYAVTGREGSFVANTDHQQQMFGGDLNVNASFRRDDFLTAPGATLFSGRAQYLFPGGPGTTRLAYFLTTSDSPGFRSESSSTTLSDSRRLFDLVASRLDLNFTTTQSVPQAGRGVRAERFDVRFGASSDFPSFTADLQYQRSIPVVADENFFGASDRTPVLSLRSTAERLLGARLGQRFPFQAEVSLGELADPATRERRGRFVFDGGVRRTEGGDGPLALDWNARFRQGVYSDDTAQYVLDYGGRVSWRFAQDSSLNMNYDFLRSFGFTPLAIDRTGRNDALTADLSWQAHRTLSVSVNSGYDVLLGSRGETPWQQVWLRSDWRPNDRMRVRASAVYDTFSRLWSTARLEFDSSILGRRLAARLRYDGRRSTWANASVLLDGWRWGNLGVSFLLDYNGYTRQFDTQQAQLVYDLHCTEAILEVLNNRVGFRSGLQVGFYIRIKALPFTTPFGLGTRGQRVGVGGGFGD